MFFPIQTNPDKAGEQYISLPNSSKKISTDFASYSMAYKDDAGEVVLEYVLPISTADTEKFTGFLLVSDWQGDAKRKVFYDNGEKVGVVALNKQDEEAGANKRVQSDCYLIDY